MWLTRKDLIFNYTRHIGSPSSITNNQLVNWHLCSVFFWIISTILDAKVNWSKSGFLWKVWSTWLQLILYWWTLVLVAIVNCLYDLSKDSSPKQECVALSKKHGVFDNYIFFQKKTILTLLFFLQAICWCFVTSLAYRGISCHWWVRTTWPRLFFGNEETQKNCKNEKELWPLTLSKFELQLFSTALYSAKGLILSLKVFFSLLCCHLKTWKVILCCLMSGMVQIQRNQYMSHEAFQNGKHGFKELSIYSICGIYILCNKEFWFAY